MLFELILAIAIGIVLGAIAGLIPGIHINLVGVLLVSASASLLAKINPIYVAALIVSMAITQTFVDFIPSVFLGCPDEDSVLSVLPGHKMLKKGKGYEAVLLTAYGSLAAIFLLLIVAVPSIFLIPSSYNYIKIGIPYLLIAASVTLIFFERKKFTAFFVLILTGILGEIILNLPSLNQPLLPLLSGLFGSSMLITSIKSKPEIPKQKITKPKVKFIRPLIGALIASPLCSFLPGLGSGQAAVLGSKISSLKKMKRKQFLVLLGATNTLVMGFSFISLYLISKTRTGAAAAIQQILGTFSLNILILIFVIIIFSGIISFYLTKFLAKIFSKIIERINYTHISIATLIVLSIVVLLISGFLGLAVFAVSTFTGLYCISLKVRRTNMMGCLLIPTIILYLFNL